MLTADEYHKCESNSQLGKTWYNLTTDIFISFLFRQEISEASDDASRKYYEDTPEQERTGLGVTEVMRDAAKAKLQSFKNQLSKFTAVANPKFGDDFMDEITKHWSNNEKPEMILDRLQLIATAVAPHHHKARWLSFWNSGIHTYEALYFPAKGFKTKELETWLNKASFWAGLEEGAIQMLANTIEEDNLEICTEGMQKPRSVDEYVQA